MISRSFCLHKLIKSCESLGAYHCYTSPAASCEPSAYSDEYANVDWDNIGFGIMPTDFMYTMKCSKDKKFKQGQLSRYGNMEMIPSAGVLNYGQGIYEGTKPYRTEDGRVLLFRPDQNAIRIRIGAERMCMVCPSVDQFVNAVKQVAFANKHWVPPPGKGTLYIRPLLFGSGRILGLAPAPEYTFLIYATPVGNYFKASLNLYVEDEFHRATPGGTGGVKSISNYAPVLKALTRVKNKGFTDVLYLDSGNKKYLEEVSCCNIFIVKENVISTPATTGTILSGITRKSIIEVARDHGYQVKEDVDEVFCTGTAVVIAPVGSVTYQNKRIDFNMGDQSVSTKLYSTLVGIQTGQIEDKKGWTVELD